MIKLNQKEEFRRVNMRKHQTRIFICTLIFAMMICQIALGAIDMPPKLTLDDFTLVKMGSDATKATYTDATSAPDTWSVSQSSDDSTVALTGAGLLGGREDCGPFFVGNVPIPELSDKSASFEATIGSTDIWNINARVGIGFRTSIDDAYGPSVLLYLTPNGIIGSSGNEIHRPFVPTVTYRNGGGLSGQINNTTITLRDPDPQKYVKTNLIDYAYLYRKNLVGANNTDFKCRLRVVKNEITTGVITFSFYIKNEDSANWILLPVDAMGNTSVTANNIKGDLYPVLFLNSRYGGERAIKFTTNFRNLSYNQHATDGGAQITTLKNVINPTASSKDEKMIISWENPADKNYNTVRFFEGEDLVEIIPDKLTDTKAILDLDIGEHKITVKTSSLAYDNGKSTALSSGVSVTGEVTEGAFVIGEFELTADDGNVKAVLPVSNSSEQKENIVTAVCGFDINNNFVSIGVSRDTSIEVDEEKDFVATVPQDPTVAYYKLFVFDDLSDIRPLRNVLVRSASTFKTIDDRKLIYTTDMTSTLTIPVEILASANAVVTFSEIINGVPCENAPKGARYNSETKTFIWDMTKEHIGNHVIRFTVTDGDNIVDQDVNISLLRDAYAPIMATDYDTAKGVTVATSKAKNSTYYPNDTVVKELRNVVNGNYVIFDNVDFSDNWPTEFKYVVTGTSGILNGIVEVRLDNPTGTLLGSVIQSTSTGGWTSYAETTVPLDYDANTIDVRGVHTICINFVRNVNRFGEPDTKSNIGYVTEFKFTTSGNEKPAEKTTLIVPAVFSDNMIIQRGKPIVVWGKSNESEVTVNFAGEEKKVAVNSGEFKITFNAKEADGQKYTLSINDGKYSKVYNNVMLGDVWIASGQSNMAYSMSYFGARNPSVLTDIENSTNPNIRLLRNDTVQFPSPKFDLPTKGWTECVPDTVNDFSATAYYFAKYLQASIDDNVPIGIIQSAQGATEIELWMRQNSYTAIDGINITVKGDNYNYSIHPILQIGIKGFIWYQGEANYNRSEAYKTALSSMISDWRTQFNAPDAPFLCVQLPMYETMDFVGIRQAELDVAQSLENVGLAVTIDTGNRTNIHPQGKDIIGYRLSLLARKLAYGETTLVASGPLANGATADKTGKVTITFDSPGTELKLSKGTEPATFEICGDDGNYLPATATISGTTVIVSNDNILNPKGVRYAYSKYPDTANLVNSADLPASPFMLNIN